MQTHSWTVRAEARFRQVAAAAAANQCFIAYSQKNLLVISEYQWRSVTPWTPSHPLFAIWPPTVLKKRWSNGGGRHSRYQWGQHQWSSSTSNGMWGFSRHTVINFSSASGFEAGEGAGQPGCDWRLLTTTQGFQRQKVEGGEGPLKWETTKILCLQYMNKELWTKSTFSGCSWKKNLPAVANNTAAIKAQWHGKMSDY